MSNIKRYAPISIAYFFLNLFVFIFWWVVTDPGNYIWFITTEEKKVLLINACSKLFLIKYYIWAVLLNAMLTSFLLLSHKRILSLLIIACTLTFFILYSFIFTPYIGRNYYIIFLNQQVSPDFQMEPVNDAGKSIGPYLLNKLQEKPSPSRKYAVKGLGEIRYEPAIDKLSSILNDDAEEIAIRAESFISLKKMKHPTSKKILENFSRNHTDTISDSTLLRTINKIESLDIY
ncbi:MAG: HEAT repeat domain-containing protein [Cytophagales bacterium]|nr:HEAT repeat domain-containing protein [Cytophaga sp.]